MSLKNGMVPILCCLILLLGCDSLPPVVQISSPTEGEVITDSVVIHSNISDDKGISSIELYIDDTLRSEFTESPVEYVWYVDELEDSSSHQIVLLANDDKGNLGADTVNVTVLVYGALVWRFFIGHESSSSPAIGDDGTIYVCGSHHNLYAISPQGELVWCSKMPEFLGPSVTVDPQGRIYLGVGFSLGCVDLQGNFLWEYRTEEAVYTPCAVDESGVVYFGSEDGYLYSLNPDSTLRWQTLTGGHLRGYPAISAEGSIYIGTRSGLASVNKDGTLNWKYVADDEIYSAPAIGPAGNIYFGSRYIFYALNPNGEEKWRYRPPSEIRCGPTIGSDGTIYIGATESGIYAFNPDGSIIWQTILADHYYGSSPTLDAEGNIYLGAGNSLYALNNDGKILWRYETGERVYYSDPVIDENGIVYITSWDGYLYAIRGYSSLADAPWPMICHDPQHTGRED